MGVLALTLCASGNNNTQQTAQTGGPTETPEPPALPAENSSNKGASKPFPVKVSMLFQRW